MVARPRVSSEIILALAPVIIGSADIDAYASPCAERFTSVARDSNKTRMQGDQTLNCRMERRCHHRRNKEKRRTAQVMVQPVFEPESRYTDATTSGITRWEHYNTMNKFNAPTCLPILADWSDIVPALSVRTCATSFHRGTECPSLESSYNRRPCAPALTACWTPPDILPFSPYGRRTAGRCMVPYWWVPGRLSIETFRDDLFRAAISVACFLWDYMLNLGNEVESRVASLSCKGSFVAVIVLAILSTASAHAYIALRLFALWEQKRSTQVTLWTTFSITCLGLIGCSIFSLRDIYFNTILSPDPHYCILSKTPKGFVGVWACVSAFDFAAMVLVVLNALHQPYRQRFEVIERIKRDGTLSFLIVFASSIVMLVLSVLNNPEEIIVAAFLGWATDSIVLTRLFFGVEHVRSRFTDITNDHGLRNVS
ncbi:hypothetical protein NM688_g6532 [Phlebia brevispora]|uniref:Uncharacterized protein n=1 Tax=Phlebia brevispora TaxID=194682 RepID=A0ACC1SF04_9APHY|nr:hypothetical protein NM688_g6532 [Phlebia brevispora]